MDSQSIMKLDFVTLRFTGDLSHLEPQFHGEYFRTALPFNRIALLVGLFFYSVFGILDAFLIPENKSTTWLIRFAIVDPVIIGTFLVSFSKFFERYANPLMAFATVTAGGGIIFMIIIAPPPVNYSYYAGLLLVFMWSYGFARISFPWAASAGWTVVILYEIAAIQISPTPFAVLINNNFFFISMNIIGMIACYSLEYYARRNFFLAKQILAERETIAMVNRKLETQTVEYQMVNKALEQQIIERKKAEAALLESEEKYRSIFDNARKGIYQIKPEGRFISVNPAMARMWGYDSPEEMIEKVTDVGSQHYVDPQGRARFRSIMEKQGSVEGMPVEIYRKDRSRMWVSLNSREVRDGEGKLLYYEGTNEDITEQKLMQDMIRENERRYRHLVENSNDIIITTDLEGIITYINPAAERISGYTVSELYGKPFHRFVRADYHKQMYFLYKKQVQEKTPLVYQEFPLFLKDGSEKWIGQQVQLIYDHDKFTGFHATAIDITDRRKVEEEQREREKLSAIVETAGMICHELNQPMQAILGQADLLSMTVKEPDPQRKRIDIIKEQIMRMSRITRKLMGITRYETKPYIGESKIVDLDKSAE